MSGVGRRNLEIEVNGAQKFEQVLEGEREEIVLEITLEPGFNRIDLQSREPAVRLSHERGQLRSFGLHEATVELD
jgi:hypothetical protein